MLSRLTCRAARANWAKSSAHSLFASSTRGSAAQTQTDVEEENPLTRPTKSPIMSGRKWKKKDTRPGYMDPELLPDPFEGRALPFGRRIIFETASEEALARGKYWNPHVDRNSEFVDFDLVDRAWGDHDHYRNPHFKRNFEDLTGEHDSLYHFQVNNLNFHVQMAQHIPHLACLMPEIREDFDRLNNSWQEVLDDVFPSDSQPGEFYEELESTSVNYYGKKEVTRYKDSKEIARRNEIRRELSLLIIKQFVDDCVEERDFARIIFVDALGTKHYVYGMVGETLLQACRRYQVPLDAFCQGYDRGVIRVYAFGPICGQCQMDLDPKYFHMMPPWDFNEQRRFPDFRTITPTSRLGCCIWIRPEYDGMMVSIPITLYRPLTHPN